MIPGAEKGTDMKADVGGSTAGYIDLASRISEKLPLQILVVIALSFVLLILAFRTAVIPAQAAVMNLLSIGASYGVLTAVFQYGWLADVIGLNGPVPIVSYVPLFMFAVLFGLSMDYEVFLVSQIEEHVHAGEDNRSSVVSGLVTSARVITAAALIMVFVFGSFVLNGDPTIKQFGVGPGRRRGARRDGRALPARAGADAADGQGQLVDAEVARAHRAAREHRGRRVLQGARRAPHRPAGGRRPGRRRSLTASASSALALDAQSTICVQMKFAARRSPRNT